MQLDIKTYIYLFLMHAKIVKIDTNKSKKGYILDNINEKEVCIFNSFEEYKDYYLMFFDDIDDELIKMAIFTRGNKGQVVAFKGLINHIILKKKMDDFYKYYTDNIIHNIHKNGKITPLEKVREWESLDLCAPGDHISSAAYRCEFFKHNCHECLLEYAMHNKEYDEFNFKLCNLPIKKRNKH